MKLATLKTNGPDGQLVVVSRDLMLARPIPQIAATLQAALDAWSSVEPQLRQVSDALNDGATDGASRFDPAQAASPLPRAYQFADGSLYVPHMELMCQWRGIDLPPLLHKEPFVYQGGSDGFLGPRDDIPLRSPDWGLDFEAEIAVIVDRVPMGTSADDAGKHIKLLMLCNDVSLRNLIPNELSKEFGFYQSKPASAFSPVAVTPDELGQAWDGDLIHLPILTSYNGKTFGQPNAGVETTFGFKALIAHLAKTRSLEAGSILGSGTVSNRDRSLGSSCITERRVLEILKNGLPTTEYMKAGDRVKIEMLDPQGNSIFGAIEQSVVARN